MESQHGRKNPQVHRKTWGIAIISTIIVYFVSGYLIQRFTDDPGLGLMRLPFLLVWVPELSASYATTINISGGWLQALPKWFFGSFHSDMAPPAAMFVNSSVYLINDVLAFTVSPWYNKRNVQNADGWKKEYYHLESLILKWCSIICNKNNHDLKWFRRY